MMTKMMAHQGASFAGAGGTDDCPPGYTCAPAGAGGAGGLHFVPEGRLRFILFLKDVFTLITYQSQLAPVRGIGAKEV